MNVWRPGAEREEVAVSAVASGIVIWSSCNVAPYRISSLSRIWDKKTVTYCVIDVTFIHKLAEPAQLRKRHALSLREKNLSSTSEPHEICKGRRLPWGKCSPYVPAGFISTVSFISPDKNAVIAFAYQLCECLGRLM